MATDDIVVILGAVCGVFMVVGGMLLFYKGIVTLQQVSDKPDAVTVEFKNVLKIQSRYPAYGFFVFGLAFISLAAMYSRPDQYPPITVSGQIEDAVDPNATMISVTVPLVEDYLDTNGKFKRKFRADFSMVRVRIQAPGNDPATQTFRLDTAASGRELVAKFDPLKLKKVGGIPAQGAIEELPSGMDLPPPTMASGLREPPK